MQGSFKLMDGDLCLGLFTIDSENDLWRYDAAAPNEQQPLVFKLALRDSGMETLLGEIVRDWIINRAPEPNYVFIDALMERVGIEEYDPLAFVAYNGGRFNTDNYYIVPGG
jgi:hypothetical protein